jgi:phosphosulfolactate synthase
MPAPTDKQRRAPRTRHALGLPARTTKPRHYGLTAVTDNGIAAGGLRDILDSYHHLIDLVKIGVGSAYIEPRLNQKLDLYGSYGIPVYFGGTLFEKHYVEGKLAEYLGWLEDLGLRWVEVSNGTTAIPPDQVARLIEKIAGRFNVLAEIGKKQPGNDPAPAEWVETAAIYRQAGCRYVVLEGRQTADIGIYDERGRLRTGLIMAIVEKTPPQRIVFEAPTADSQNQLINRFGANVNLGNVSFTDLLMLECQRVGLREETFSAGDTPDFRDPGASPP